jgi:hypothetical protein
VVGDERQTVGAGLILRNPTPASGGSVKTTLGAS